MSFALGCALERFRPLQGLPIMNSGYDYDKETGAIKFPSPTGVNHYEYKVIELIKAKEKQFPSPTGVKYYE